ncbi:MAG: YciI family protein [Dehalococcoidia bacterium]
MKYALLIYENEGQADQSEEQMGRWWAYTEELQKSGQGAGGEALQPIATATTVRVRDGKTVTTDGPFAETKEQLGGFYLVDCNNLDEAIAWAAKIPNSNSGSIEVRPLLTFDDMPEHGQ